MRRKPDPTDIGVGKRIRSLREQNAFTQEQVAAALGVTFQQVQKYENGHNRTAPSRLTVMAKMFKVPVAAFFDEKPASNGSEDTSRFVRLVRTGRFDDELARLGYVKKR